MTIMVERGEQDPLIVPITGAFNPMLKVPFISPRGHVRQMVLSPAGWEFSRLTIELESRDMKVAEPIVLEKFGIQNLFEMSEQVDELIEQRRRKHHGRPVITVGHSLGGVVGAHLFVNKPEIHAGAVTVGSPHSIEEPINEQFFRHIKRVTRVLDWLGRIDLHGYEMSHQDYKKETMAEAEKLGDRTSSSMVLVGSAADRLVPPHSAIYDIPGSQSVLFGSQTHPDLIPGHIGMLTNYLSVDIIAERIEALAASPGKKEIAA